MSTQARAPPQPVYILRGHSAQVHALHFYNDNLRLLTGDADGWVVVWSLVSRRSTAVWRAHEKSILTLYSWTGDRIITHGRDDALRVWHIPAAAESSLSKALPAEGYSLDRQSPWLLHSLQVNTMNFCSFAACQLPPYHEDSDEKDKDRLLIAVPGTQDGYVHIHELPSEQCVHVVPPAATANKSLTMAIKLYYAADALHVVTGNEAGDVSVQRLRQQGSDGRASVGQWHTLYCVRAHTQPVLSLDLSPAQARIFTSSADALITSHPLPVSPSTTTTPTQADMLSFPTGHAGQQSLVCRDDSRILATAGWDARVRVYSAKTLREVAVLKWHREGCYAVAFGCTVRQDGGTSGDGMEGDGATLERDEAAADAAGEQKPLAGSEDQTVSLSQSGSSNVMTVQQRREESTRAMHWLAAGSKDGKVSLWNVF